MLHSSSLEQIPFPKVCSYLVPTSVWALFLLSNISASPNRWDERYKLFYSCPFIHVLNIRVSWNQIQYPTRANLTFVPKDQSFRIRIFDVETSSLSITCDISLPFIIETFRVHTRCFRSVHDTRITHIPLINTFKCITLSPNLISLQTRRVVLFRWLN